MNKLASTINKIEEILLLALLFLYPLFITTLFPNVFETSKLALLLIGIGLIAIAKIVKLLINNSFEINIGKFDIFMVLFALLFLISGLVTAPNKVEAFLVPGNAAFAIAATLIYFIVNQKEKEFKDIAIITFISSIFILSIYQILNFAGTIKVIPFIPEVMKLKSFNLMGNILSLIVISVSTLPFLIKKLVTKSDISEKILSSLVLVTITIGIAISIYLALPGKDTSVNILNLKTNWQIAADSIKESPFLGVGPSNFLYAFNRFKSIEFNSFPSFNTKFLLGSSMFMTSLVEVGLIIVALFVYFIMSIYKNVAIRSDVFATFAILLLGILLLPLSFSALPVIFAIFALYSKTESHKMGYFIKKVPQVLIVLPFIAVLVFLTYLYARGFYAEYLFLKSIRSVGKNEAVSAYNYINNAVSVNPYSDRIHQYASTLNIALAESLAKKEKPTEEDKQNIARLIQQAIREGRAAVAVNPNKSSNWEGLSDLYRSVMSYAKGADNFVAETLKQAITLDPINPILRIKLGSLFYSLGKYDEAIDVLKLAVLAKPDYPNSRYNLALAYREAKQIDKAKEQINIVLSLLGKESKDYNLALQELKNLESLTEPSPTPEPLIDPKLELPAQ